ncbi:MAG: hypothetical protein Q9220_007732 [cf. Caloplaca sp. 1 TL-2023]
MVAKMSSAHIIPLNLNSYSSPALELDKKSSFLASSIEEHPTTLINANSMVERQAPAPESPQRVTIFENGVLLDASYLDFFTCKPPLASPPPPPPPPSPIPYLFYSGYFADSAGLPPAGTSSSTWAVFTAIQDPATNTADYDPCADKPVYVDSEPGGAEPKYPVSKGPFDGGGQVGCTYKRVGDDEGAGTRLDPGNLVCGGVSRSPFSGLFFFRYFFHGLASPRASALAYANFRQLRDETRPSLHDVDEDTGEMHR